MSSLTNVIMLPMPGTEQHTLAKEKEKKRQRVYAKRVPSSLPPEKKVLALGWLKSGRNVHQCAQEFSCSEVVIVEVWLRDVARRLAALEHGGFAA